MDIILEIDPDPYRRGDRIGRGIPDVGSRYRDRIGSLSNVWPDPDPCCRDSEYCYFFYHLGLGLNQKVKYV